MERENYNDCNKKLEATHLNYEDVDQGFIRQWCKLESRVVEDNAYLSPYFVLPAIKYLSNEADIHIVAVFAAVAADEKKIRDDEKQLCGLAIFTYCRGSFAFPLPHMIAYKSVHSYLSGLLVDNTDGSEIVEKIFSFLRTSHPRVYGVSFTELPLSGKLGPLLMRQVGKNGVHWFERSRKLRAFLRIRPAESSMSWDGHISSKRRKNYRRAVKGLSARGKVSWDLIAGPDVSPSHIENFLRLEHAGWKSQRNSSLLSRGNHEKFFKEMVKGFSGNCRIFFSELMIDRNAIASTCNLVAGRTGFAFKIGWDVGLQEFSPGIVNEMEFLKNVDTATLSIDEIDSGADETSFINSYWPQRKQLVAGVFAFGIGAGLVLKGVDFLSAAKRIVWKLLGKRQAKKFG